MKKFAECFHNVPIVSTLSAMEQHLHQALIEARERLAQRGVLLDGVGMSDVKRGVSFI